MKRGRTEPDDSGPTCEPEVRDLVRALFGQRAPHPARPLPARLGRYELLEVLGRGGAGVVYRARADDGAEELAIKTLGAATARDRARLRREAELLASLTHPGLVRVHGLEHDGDELFLVLERVPGASLATRLRQGAPGRERALEWVRQILDAMAAVHAAGIVHRDVKPANVLIDEQGRARVLDFGLAKMPGGSSLTGEEAFGTPAYMAPEQRRAAAQATPRSDVYSLALVVFEILTGARMTRSLDPSERPSFTLRDRRALARVSPSLVSVIGRALDPDPARRPADAGALSRELERALARDVVLRRALASAALLLAIALVAALALARS